MDWSRRPHWTCTQIAHALAVAPRTVRAWCAAGLLPATRTLGGHHRVRREALAIFTPPIPAQHAAYAAQEAA